jgi:hypothetical protein
VSRFSPQSNPTHPDHLVSAIVTLAERTNRLAVDTAMAASTADNEGRLTVLVDEVCRLAVGAGVATGEIAWLVGELEAAGADADGLAEAEASVTALERCMRAVTGVVEDLAGNGGPVEVSSAAGALARVCTQLERLIPRLQPT